MLTSMFLKRYNYLEDFIMKRKNESNIKSKYSYIKKEFMTAHEFEYYKIFKSLESELNVIIQPQVSLISLIRRDNYYGTEYPKELNRLVDFAVFDNNYNLILLIEIGDNSHKKRERIIRDIYVKKICKNANIKLIYFVPNKYKNDYEAQDYLRNEIIFYYDCDRETTFFETVN